MRISVRQPNTFTSFYCRTKYFQSSFLPRVIRVWNKLDPDKWSCLSYSSFHKALLNFIRPTENEIFNIHDQVGTKLLTRLRLGFSHLCQHKYWHNFEGILNSLCLCSIETETTLNFFLRCQFFNDIREILMNELIGIADLSYHWVKTSQSAFCYIEVMLLTARQIVLTARPILICTAKFIKDSHRFEDSFF